MLKNSLIKIHFFTLLLAIIVFFGCAESTPDYPLVSVEESTFLSLDSIEVFAVYANVSRSEIIDFGAIYSTSNTRSLEWQLENRRVHGEIISDKRVAVRFNISPSSTYFIRVYFETKHGIVLSDPYIIKTKEQGAIIQSFIPSQVLIGDTVTLEGNFMARPDDIYETSYDSIPNVYFGRRWCKVLSYSASLITFILGDPHYSDSFFETGKQGIRLEQYHFEESFEDFEIQAPVLLTELPETFVAGERYDLTFKGLHPTRSGLILEHSLLKLNKSLTIRNIQFTVPNNPGYSGDLYVYLGSRDGENVVVKRKIGTMNIIE
ncbi:MAG: hypothetical protein ABJ004_14965 [Cyclobacteriaceae bacterium]